MYAGKTFIAIIPARGGSKGLPGKNLRELFGKPLVAWSIEAACSSSLLDEIVVTTDSEEIAEVSRRYGATVPFLRPAELATDAAPTIDAVEHALEFYEAQYGRIFDFVVLLEPTSPLREPGDVDAMITTLVRAQDRFDSIISVGEVREHPAHVKRIVDGILEPFCPGMPFTLRRQDNEPAFSPYGVGMIVKTEVLRNERTFYTRRTAAYQLRRHQSYEIDDIYDFLAVEAVMRSQSTRHGRIADEKPEGPRL